MNTSAIADLRQYLSEKNTEIKLINGHYYMCIALRAKNTLGKCIGKVVVGKFQQLQETVSVETFYKFF